MDLSHYRADCGVSVQQRRAPDHGLVVEWSAGEGETGRLVLDVRAGRPLIESLGLVPEPDARDPEERVLLKSVDPVFFVTVGTRNAPAGRPPSMSVFNVFFDSPAQRPHQSYRATLTPKQIRVASEGRRARVIVDGLVAGPFSGSLEITVYAQARLVHVEAAMHTEEERRAYLYDAGLAAESPSWTRFGWIDTEGKRQRADVDPQAADRAIAVRHRVLVAESDAGSVACFPPPHAYFFPRDLTDNLRYTWYGRGHRGLDDRFGFGVRQSETGGGNFVPWFNAPPGTEQRMGVFYLLSSTPAPRAIREALRYTHRDRFPELPGYSTFTSHWHMEIALAALREQRAGKGRTIPDLVRIFKDMGVNIVHLAEFHGEGHQGDPGPIRWPELEAMFAESRRLSDREILFLPGEEVSGILGDARPGQHPGHWMCLFPHPVYWAQKRAPGAPFSETLAPYGTVYRVGGRDDMVRLLEREHGLAWTSHPRVKASSWAPDAFRNEDYYQADFWLGAAWKALPADLSRPRLGERALNLLDDMTGWGSHKYMPGEVDVFKIDHTHELYGHMNINYLRLDHPPRYDESWQPVLDALRGGRFFVTTGEVLLREFKVDGEESGASVSLGSSAKPEVRLELEWTFPLRCAELVSGDGSTVYRERIDLSDTGPFGRRVLTLRPDLRGRRWVRAEAWDVAGDGAFTQPVWLSPGS